MSQILNMPPLQLNQKLPIQSLKKRHSNKERRRSLAPLLPTGSSSHPDRYSIVVNMWPLRLSPHYYSCGHSAPSHRTAKAEWPTTQISSTAPLYSSSQNFYITPNMINSLSTLQVGRVIISCYLCHLEVMWFNYMYVFLFFSLQSPQQTRICQIVARGQLGQPLTHLTLILPVQFMMVSSWQYWAVVYNVEWHWLSSVFVVGAATQGCLHQDEAVRQPLSVLEKRLYKVTLVLIAIQIYI